MTHVNSLKNYALNLAERENLYIENRKIKSATEILSEITQHKIELALLSKKTSCNITGEKEALNSIYNLAKRNLLSLAEKYNIPFEKDDLITDSDYGLLRDKVEYWTDLLDQADSNGIYWEESDYDPIGLTQEINDAEHSAYKENLQLRSDYYNRVL